MTKLFKAALEIATEAHKGQVDKAGKAYIDHPLFVASKMETEEEKAVALLHDVLEDSDYTADDLLKAGIPEKVLEAVKAITHLEGQDYFEYLKGVKANPLACKVKIQDVLHNSDITRIENPTEKDFARLNKYKNALDFLRE